MGSNFICQCLHFTGWWSLVDQQDRRVGRWYPLGTWQFLVWHNQIQSRAQKLRHLELPLTDEASQPEWNTAASLPQWLALALTELSRKQQLLSPVFCILILSYREFSMLRWLPCSWSGFSSYLLDAWWLIIDDNQADEDWRLGKWWDGLQ